MALFSDIRLDVPGRCSIVSVKGIKYVYYRTAYYRNANKKATTKRKCIGRYDEETGKMIPNEGYYELFHLPYPGLPERIRSFGLYNVLLMMAEESGLRDILERYFPDTWKEIRQLLNSTRSKPDSLLINREDSGCLIP